MPQRCSQQPPAFSCNMPAASMLQLLLLLLGVTQAVVGKSLCPCLALGDCPRTGNVAPVGWICQEGRAPDGCGCNYYKDGVYANGYICCYPMDCMIRRAPYYAALGSCPSSLASGASCSFTCIEGYQVDRLATSCAAGFLTQQQCVPSPCQPLTALPQNAMWGACPINATLQSGESCAAQCNSGYAVTGTESNAVPISRLEVSCSAGRLRTDTCSPRACAVTAPANGGLGDCPSTLQSGLQCSFTCNHGFPLSGSATSCTRGVLVPQVCAAPCTITPPINGVLDRCASPMQSGTSCQFACSPGYALAGPATTCFNGVVSAQQCLRPCAVAAPTNGAYNSCPSRLLPGQSCSISCNDGYAVVGAATTCVDGSITSQSCAPAPCPVVPPTNGALNGCPASLPSGSSCTFSCNTGYTLSETSTACLAGVLTAQTCLTPEEIAAASAARTASRHSTASGLPPGVQEALISIASALGAAAAAFGGWYWKRSNDARKRAQRRALAAAIFEHLPFVDADAFDSPTGQEFTDAVDALARRVGQAYPKLMHGLLINHPRLPLPQLEELGRAISASARAAGLELNAPTMPAVVACIFRCQQFKGALVTHFADEHMQRAIVAALGTTLEDDRMQAALRALAIKLQAQVTPDVQPGSGEASDAAASPFEGVEVELTAGMPSSDA